VERLAEIERQEIARAAAEAEATRLADDARKQMAARIAAEAKARKIAE